MSGSETMRCYLEDWKRIWTAHIKGNQRQLKESINHHAYRLTGHSGATLKAEVERINMNVIKNSSRAAEYLERIDGQLS